jgi:hypothetical protein
MFGCVCASLRGYLPLENSILLKTIRASFKTSALYFTYGTLVSLSPFFISNSLQHPRLQNIQVTIPTSYLKLDT